jgi:DNA-binding PucR family transcriptional regulator
MTWQHPSERTCDLLRQGAEIALNSLQEWLDEIDEATLAAVTMRAIAQDPALRAATLRINRAHLAFWASETARDPGAPVPAYVGPDSLSHARDLVRRGLDESALDSYRVGQNAAWRRWMQTAFTLTSDPDELRELLDVSARSVSGFLDATIVDIAARMAAEREELTHGTHAERREIVTLLVEGAPISRQRAEARLGYALDRTHTAAVVWSEEPSPEPGHLERATEVLAQTTGVQQPLTVIVGAATLWVWLPGPAAPDTGLLSRLLDPLPGVRIAVGPPARGREGFRRSHLDALTTQRMLARLRSPRRVAGFDDVQLSSLISQDVEQADDFVKTTLGDLATASPELRHAVLTYIQAQCNTTRAARRLYTHRNTLLRQLDRAGRLLPRPLEDNTVKVAVALDLLQWRGSD